MPISSHELKFFKTNFFVETGSAGLGWGINSAIIAGFNKIYSVEINPIAYNECKEIFKNEPKVNLTLGDCGTWLDITLNKLKEQCTIFLDANGWYGETESPFHSSIDAIVRHGGKNHLILVDDQNHGHRKTNELINDLKNPECDIIKELKRINSDYTFYLIDTNSEDLKNHWTSWVLVADPVKNRILPHNMNKATV